MAEIEKIWVRQTKKYPRAENGCTGECCQNFILTLTYEDLKARVGEIRDGEFVLDMLIPLGRWEKVSPEGFNKPGHEGGDRMVYKCRHFNDETGRCNEYENRPHVCRIHDPGLSCRYGCAQGWPFDVSLSRLKTREKIETKLERLAEEYTGRVIEQAERESGCREE